MERACKPCARTQYAIYSGYSFLPPQQTFSLELGWNLLESDFPKQQSDPAKTNPKLKKLPGFRVRVHRSPYYHPKKLAYAVQ